MERRHAALGAAHGARGGLSARKLKVVVNAIPAANPVTGIGRYVLELYRAIAEVGGGEVDVRYFDGRTLSDRPPEPPADVRAFSRIASAYWKLPLALALPIRLAVHRRRERAFRALSAGADIAHETAFFPFRSAPGVRVVQTVHDLSLQLHPQWHPRERVAYAARYFRTRLAWSAAILCVSEFTRGELAAFAPEVAERSRVTPLGVDARFHPPSPGEVARVRSRYALPDKYVLFVGSGDPRKNAAILDDIAARGRLPCMLVRAGWEGWLPPAAAGRELSLGYVPDADLPGLYGAAAAFAFPSLHEGFGLPVLEAMACGCPVVVPRAHAMPELAGDAGIYYGDPRDVDALESSLVRVLTDPALARSAAEAGLARARRFDWRETARATLAAFEEAMRASPSAGRDPAPL